MSTSQHQLKARSRAGLLDRFAKQIRRPLSADCGEALREFFKRLAVNAVELLNTALLCFKVLRTPVLTMLVLALSLSACSKPKEQSSQDDVNEAQWEMDHGKVNQAIDRLNSRLQKDPDNRQVRVVLASAYALRAGLPASRFADLAEFWIERNRQGRQLVGGRLERRSTTGTTTSRIQDQNWEALLLGGLGFFLDAKANFDLLPVPETEAQKSDLQLAIKTLEDLSIPSRGIALYRALLRVINLKYHLVHGKFTSEASTNTKANSISTSGQSKLNSNSIACVDATAFTRSFSWLLTQWLEEADLAISDFMIAYPGQRSWLASSREDIQQTKSAISEVSQLAQPIQSTEDLLKLRLWVERNLDWKWSCGE